MITKKRQMELNRIRAWERSTATSLDDVYKSCSSAKRRAWMDCEALCALYNGTDLKIVSHNCMVFSAAFQFADREDGNLKLMYITRDHDYEYDL